jgi:glycosyltransferase involved in cell wall biosynthesis
MKISVVTPRFAIAGVPLAQIRFARALADRGHDVDLIIGYIDPRYSFTIPAEVNVVYLNRHKVRRVLFPLIKYLKKVNPDVIFSAEDHLNIIVLIAAIISGSKAKISGSSRVTPIDTYSNTLFTKRWILKQFMRAVMWRADALTCVSMGTVKEYRHVFNSPPHVCVYNVIDDRHSRLKMEEPIKHDWLICKDFPVLVAAGRLAPWKGYSDLLHAMKALSERRQVRLIILGDGPLRSELEVLVTDLGLNNIVSLQGYVENPLNYFVHADLFVHSAHVESLGNVLVEAMMCGCTPVSTDCPTGPREVLQDGKYGYLVPMRDPVAMAAAIEKALDNPIPKELLAEAVRPFEEHLITHKSQLIVKM